jgi:Enoyl-CoA hydratase/isomerase
MSTPTYFHAFTLNRPTPALWRATFNHPPINLIDGVMIRELSELFAEVERNEGPAVIVFDSADPDYFLAHYDIGAATRSLVGSLPPTGFHPWLYILVRLSELPAVTIAAIRGRARSAGSEFVLAGDVRFASRERAVLGPDGSRLRHDPWRGAGVSAAGSGRTGPGVRDPSRRGGLRRRTRRAIRLRQPSHSDDEFEDFVDRFARRVSRFDRQALADIKRFVNSVSLPADTEFPPQMEAFGKAATGPASKPDCAERSRTAYSNAPTSNCDPASTWDRSRVPSETSRRSARRPASARGEWHWGAGLGSSQTRWRRGAVTFSEHIHYQERKTTQWLALS